MEVVLSNTFKVGFYHKKIQANKRVPKPNFFSFAIEISSTFLISSHTDCNFSLTSSVIFLKIRKQCS